MSNTITAYFKGRVGVAESVYQNDYGIVMAFDSIALPAHFDCFFSRLNQEEALPGLGADNRVTIPNSILANPGNVTIHIPLHTGEDDSEVEYVIYFKVIGRARPIDDGTPAQMTAIERALALLSQPITNIEEIVNEALSFTGDTFAEMKQELADDFAEYKGDVDDDIADFKTEVRDRVSDVESDFSDLSDDFDNLDAQFQTAVAAVTTDTEVTNIRVGDDNVTYTTAGEAVRKQFADVKKAMNIKYSYSTGATFVLKHIDATGMLVDNNNKNAAFELPLLALKGSTVSVDAGYKFQMALHNKSTGAFIERKAWMTETYTFANDYLVRIEISDTSESVLPDTSISSHLHYSFISQKYIPYKATNIEFTRLSNISLNYSIGQVVNLTPSSIASYRHAIVDCGEGDIFIINAKGGESPRVWGFLDADNKLISVAASNTASVAQTNLMLIAPTSSAKLILNDQNTGGICTKYDDIENIKYRIDNIENKLDLYALKNQVEEALAQSSNIVNAIGMDIFRNKIVDIAEPNEYEAWPFVGAANGRLVCVYSRGRSHSDGAYPAIFSKISTNGVIWSMERNVVNTDGVRDTITGKGNNSNGDFIFWNRVGQPNSGSESFHLYKTEDGITFDLVSSPSFSILPAHIGDIINVPTVGLMAFFNTLGSGTRTWGMLVSNDNGETWTQVAIESNIPNTDCPVEISAAYLGDGKIIAIGRKDVVGDTTNAFFQMQSDDYGATWTRAYTNIIETAGNQPSLLYDADNTELNLYFYYRGAGVLWKYAVNPTDVWSNPTNWSNGEIIAHGSTSYEDAGQVNATMFGDTQIAVFYSGTPTSTGIYGILV